MLGMVSNANVASATSPRRFWWQRVLRAAIVAVVLCLCAYLTLPYWLPTGFIARQFTSGLSQKLGLPVSINRLDISWSEGVRIQGFSIGSGEKGGPSLVNVSEIQADFSPIRFMLTQQTQRAQLTGLRVNAVVDDSGNVNLAKLTGMSLGRPPEHVIIRDGLVSVTLPHEKRQLQLSISDLQYRSGRFDRLGRFVMYAMLKQPQRDADITLLAGESDVVGETSACSFAFRQVNLEHLHLPAMLGLPMKALTGLATGRLDCQLNATGVIDQFTLDVQVQDLNAQPAHGPALPVIALAQIQVDAAFDLVFKQMQFRSLRVKLPGIDLTGKGRLHEDLFAGLWQGVRELNLEGRINPGILATLLQGKPGLPGGLDVEGDMGFHLSLEGHETEMRCSAGMDAGEAQISLPGRMLKRHGTVLTGEISGSFETATGRVIADRTELRWGGNVFRGSGAIENIIRMAGQLSDASHAAPPTVLAQLGQFDWSGSWEINELDSLHDAVGPGWMDEVKLTGRLVGEWSMERGGVFDLHGLRAPAGTQLRVGDWFIKPSEAVLRLEISGKLSSESGLSRARVVAGVGEGEVEVELEKASIVQGQRESSVVLEGDYDIQDAQSILQCFSGLCRPGHRIAGAATGRFQAVLGKTFGRVYADSDATHLEVALGDAFVKPAGQAASLTLDWRSDDSLPGPQRNELDTLLTMSSLSLESHLNFGQARREDRPEAMLRGRLEVADVASLLDRSPLLQRLLGPQQLRGPVTAQWNLHDDGQVRQGEVLVRADDLEFSVPATGGRKARGTPLRLRVAGELDANRAALTAATLDLGGSSVNLAGEVQIAPTAAKASATRPATPWPPPMFKSGRMHWEGSFALDDSATALVPALARAVTAAQLKGSVQTDGELTADENVLLLDASASADELTFASHGVEKQAAWPVNVRVQARVDRDLKSVRVNDLFMDCPAFQVRAGVDVPLLSAGAIDCHAAWTCPDLGKLQEILPQAAQYKAGGCALGETQFTLGRDLQNLNVKYATLTADHVTAQVDARDFAANGSVRFERPRLDDSFDVGRVVCEELEVTSGRSHGFVMADIEHPLHNPMGRFDLTFDHLDLVELLHAPSQEQVACAPAMCPASAPSSPSGGPAATASAPISSAPAGVAVQAQQKARDFLTWCQQSNLHGVVQANSVRYYEGVVKAYYEVLGMVANFDIEGERLAGGFRAGLNGGQIEQRYTMNLRDWPLLLVAHNELHDVEPLANIQIQLAAQFPGNTVKGSFSRQEDMTVPLQSLILTDMDPRYKAIPVGSAITFAQEGVVRGQAGPSFLTKLFPGLNLASYPYRTMTGYADYTADGTATMT